MVHVFAVENVVHGYHEYKDVWNAPADGREFKLPCERIIIIIREPGNPRNMSAVAIFEPKPQWLAQW